MANYGGDYQLDPGYIQKAARLRVFAVDLILGDRSKFDGNSRATALEFDLQFLPQIFINHVANKVACCGIPTNTERHARAYFQDDSYLFISCPFRGGTSEHLLFYRQLTENSKIRLVEAHGETLGIAETVNFTRV
jgi:hypothetical protein